MNFLAQMKLKRLQKRAKYLFDKRDSGAVVNINNETKILKQLGEFYFKHRFNKSLPHADVLAVEYYRAAANLNDAEAQYILGKSRLELGRFWQTWRDGAYGEELHQAYADTCFKEAFENLNHADKNGYPLAKRLYGLAYINGWGMPVDQERGFQLVVDSIEEAKAWDKATEIFQQLGLNKPEFFSTMMQLRKK